MPYYDIIHNVTNKLITNVGFYLLIQNQTYMEIPFPVPISIKYVHTKSFVIPIDAGSATQHPCGTYDTGPS